VNDELVVRLAEGRDNRPKLSQTVPFSRVQATAHLQSRSKCPRKCKRFLGRRILFMVNYGLFMTDSLSRDMSHPHALA